MKRSIIPLTVTLLTLLFFYIPIILLVAQSFNASRYSGAWTGFTLEWYARLFRDRNIWMALRNSLAIGLGATTLSMVFGTTAALALDRYRSRLQRTHYILIYMPLVIPDILMGMCLLLFFVSLGMKLGLLTIFLAHVTFCISYVAMVVLARLQDFDHSLVEAARDLGATRRQAATRVLLPLLAPGILSGGLLAFTLSIDDFVISFFVAGPGATTLPIYIYSMIKHGAPPVINALSTILLFITFALIITAQMLTWKKEKTT
ncbi:MAG: ABC transporter permease [Kiritimatiellae bacterium]|nr:ABC transporter permease [Kiritimatiellia bacterium]MDD4736865.1 ABC transporter permease [Kiritimatiellia bacterium]